MRPVVKFVVVACSALLGMNAAQAAKDPTTFVGPTIQGSYSGWISDISAFSLLSEVGGKDFRLSGTLGWQFQDSQQIKVSGEYLWQRINYPFASHNSNQWFGQAAGAFDYQYLINYPFNPTFDLTAFISHTTTKTLDTVGGRIFRHGVAVPYLAARRVAGAPAAVGASSGLEFDIWCGARGSLSVNYDNVRYDNQYVTSGDATGFGGTAHFTQSLNNNLLFGFTASVRQPFNDYQANINWSTNYFGRWSVGAFGEYVNGKEGLPNSYNLGLTFDYYMDRFITVAPASIKGEGAPVVAPFNEDFLNWVSDPAIYMPQTLAVPDEGFQLV